MLIGNAIRINRSKVVQRKMSYQISLLKFWIRNMITELWAWVHGGGATKNKHRMVLGVFELVEKYFSFNILNTFNISKIAILFKKVNFKPGGNFRVNTKRQFMTEEFRNFVYLLYLSIWNRGKFAPNYYRLILEHRGNPSLNFGAILKLLMLVSFLHKSTLRIW